MMSMSRMHGRILLRSTATTAVAAVLAVVVFVLDRSITGADISERDWLETILIPIVVGMPIAWYVFTQNEKLSTAYHRLAESNAATERAYRQLKQADEIIDYAAHHDQMTGLFNREHFLNEVERAYEVGARDVLLILDVDQFSLINDNYGHATGDAALVAISRLIRQAVRVQDQIGRLGSEEFGVLLKQVFLSEAAELAECIRLDIASASFLGPRGLAIPLTVSIGGACLGDFPEGVASAIAHADRCLHRAKRSGRNRVEFDINLVQVAQTMHKAAGVQSSGTFATS